jgi:hypothetical protein
MLCSVAGISATFKNTDSVEAELLILQGRSIGEPGD